VARPSPDQFFSKPKLHKHEPSLCDLPDCNQNPNPNPGQESENPKIKMQIQMQVQGRNLSMSRTSDPEIFHRKMDFESFSSRKRMVKPLQTRNFIPKNSLDFQPKSFKALFMESKKAKEQNFMGETSLGVGNSKKRMKKMDFEGRIGNIDVRALPGDLVEKMRSVLNTERVQAFNEMERVKEER
jgi:hypothetical protein